MITANVTQDDIDEGPTQDAFRGPVNSAIRRALNLHEGDMVIVRSKATSVQRRGQTLKHCLNPEDLTTFCELYDSEGDQGKRLVQPSSFVLDLDTR